MIDPKDLRIGNTIYDRHGNVSHIHAGWFYITQDTKRLEDYSPIPLTPEILEKCGWGKSDEHEIGTNMLNENNDGLYFDYHFKRFRMDFGDNADIRMPHIQYLHQLQNLFYSLTGDELDIVW